MQIAFRTDASLQIGTGHVMRCLTLAVALRDKGAECHFVCRAHTANLIDTIRQKGFVVHALSDKSATPPPYSGRLAHKNWLSTDWASDAAQTLSALGSTRFSWMVVDHYALDECWELATHTAYRRIMAIDDLADRPHRCDLLLDQNIGRKAEDYMSLIPSSCTALVGANYALLRPDFKAFRESSQARVKGEIRHLLISLGGIDQNNDTTRILEALNGSSLPSACSITVIMGGNAPWVKQVRDQASHMRWKTRVLLDVANMAQLMAESDLAIGAAGGSALERCCLGLPTLLLVLAENQRRGAHALSVAGCAKLIDENRPMFGQLQAKLSELMQADVLSRIRNHCFSTVDGQGTQRVITEMLSRC